MPGCGWPAPTPSPAAQSRSRRSGTCSPTSGMQAAGRRRPRPVGRAPSNPAASPRGRPARPGLGSAWAAPRLSGNRSKSGTCTNSPYRASSQGPIRPCSPKGKPAGGGERQQRLAGQRAVAKEFAQPAQAGVQQRHLSRVGLRDAQDLVRIGIVAQAAIGHLGRLRRRRVALFPIPLAELQRRVPGRAQAGQVAPEQERPRRRLQPVDDLDEAAGQVGLVEAAFAGHPRLPGRIDGDDFVEIARPRGVRGPSGRRSAARCRRRPRGAARPGWADSRRRAQGVPALPIGAIQGLQPRRVDEHLVEDHRLAGQAVDRGRVDPAIAEGPQVSRMQPIDDQADGVHTLDSIGLSGRTDAVGPTA